MVVALGVLRQSIDFRIGFYWVTKTLLPILVTIVMERRSAIFMFGKQNMNGDLGRRKVGNTSSHRDAMSPCYFVMKLTSYRFYIGVSWHLISTKGMKLTTCLLAYTPCPNPTNTLQPKKGSGYGAGMARVWRRCFERFGNGWIDDSMNFRI
jgi:hypothetical protein